MSTHGSTQRPISVCSSTLRRLVLCWAIIIAAPNLSKAGLTDFISDFRAGFRDNTVKSVVVQGGVLKVQLADSPIRYFDGVVSMACVFASSNKVQLKELRIVSAKKSGWAYSLSTQSCQDVIREITNPKPVGGRSALQAFVEAHRRPILGLD